MAGGAPAVRSLVSIAPVMRSSGPARLARPLPAADRAIQSFRYPVLAYPEKVKSFNLDKVPEAGGVLQGIKGQYLIFDGGVINLRKYTGYKVEILAE